MSYDEKLFRRAADSLGLRFPVAEISESTNHAKSAVSQYYNGKLRPSKKFLSKFENFYKIKTEDFSQNESGSENKKSDKTHSLSDYSNLEILEYVSSNIEEFSSMSLWNALMLQSENKRYKEITDLLSKLKSDLEN